MLRVSVLVCSRSGSGHCSVCGLLEFGSSASTVFTASRSISATRDTSFALLPLSLLRRVLVFIGGWFGQRFSTGGPFIIT